MLNDHMLEIQRLIRGDYNLAILGFNGRQPHYESLYECLDGLEVKYNDHDLQALFFLAVRKRNYVAVEGMLKYGIDPNVQNQQGDTALHIAARMGENGLVSILIDSFADPGIKNNQGNDVFVCSLRNPEILDFLIVRCGLTQAQIGNNAFILSLESAANRDDKNAIKLRQIAADLGQKDALRIEKNFSRNEAPSDSSILVKKSFLNEIKQDDGLSNLDLGENDFLDFELKQDEPKTGTGLTTKYQT